MVFSSISFLFFFLPTLIILYYLIPKRLREARNFVLLMFSLFFYGYGGPRFLLLMLVSIAVNYVCGLAAGGKHSQTLRRWGVIAALVVGLGLLGWYKYAGFLAETLNRLGTSLPIPQVVLPIGISFFTFQGLSYVIDVYRGDAEVQRNPLRVALYISLFPQLVAGPIVRYTTVEEEIGRRKESLSEFTQGAVRLLFGLAKKMLIANAMGRVADDIFAMNAATLSAPVAWLGALAYTAQIYFDFSAYSDMAIGLGRMFGFHFLENFEYPYISRSIREFWRRWHISLSSWFRDYVYIPLGGSRCRVPRHIFNLFVVWLLTGLWHGASWNFVVWGLWFFVLLLGERYLWGGLLERLPSAARHVYAMLLIVIGWVFFRSDTMGNALTYLGAMAGRGGSTGAATYYLLEYWPEWIAAVIACLPVKIALERALDRRIERPGCRALRVWGPRCLALVLLALSYASLATGVFNPFIYFRF